MVIISGTYERHWTARVVRVLVKFYLREWKWVWGTSIALAGLCVVLSRMA